VLFTKLTHTLHGDAGDNKVKEFGAKVSSACGNCVLWRSVHHVGMLGVLGSRLSVF
jgi:hypothetical protein